MNMHSTFLKYLLYLQLNPAQENISEHCVAMKSGSTLPFCNRVCAAPGLQEQEINDVISYFGTTPFRWFVDVQDTQLIELLKQNNFEFACSYPGMILELNELPEIQHDSTITIQEIKSADDIATWVDIVAKSYGTDAPEFAKFIVYLQNNCPANTLRFYCAYYNGIPVATTLTIQHDDIIGVHWVGTLPEYRGKGIGYAITHKSLVDAKHTGAKQAILMASQLGKPVYAKMGFTEFAVYDVYKK